MMGARRDWRPGMAMGVPTPNKPEPRPAPGAVRPAFSMDVMRCSMPWKNSRCAFIMSAIRVSWATIASAGFTFFSRPRPAEAGGAARLHHRPCRPKTNPPRHSRLPRWDRPWARLPSWPTDTTLWAKAACRGTRALHCRPGRLPRGPQYRPLERPTSDTLPRHRRHTGRSVATQWQGDRTHGLERRRKAGRREAEKMCLGGCQLHEAHTQVLCIRDGKVTVFGACRSGHGEHERERRDVRCGQECQKRKRT